MSTQDAPFTSRGAEIRAMVARYSDEGLDDAAIAARVGITVSRVYAILDALEQGHLRALPPVPARPPAPHPAGPKPPGQLAVVQEPPLRVPAQSAGTKAGPAGGDQGNATAQRAGLPADQLPARTRMVCGSPAGYQVHLKRHEKPCDDCRSARNAYQRERREARAAAAAAAGRQKVAVRWLVPRGLDHRDFAAEYAVRDVNGHMQAVSADTAELRAADGEQIFTRWATPWMDAR